jgi:hypothetical protein
LAPSFDGKTSAAAPSELISFSTGTELESGRSNSSRLLSLCAQVACDCGYQTQLCTPRVRHRCGFTAISGGSYIGERCATITLKAYSDFDEQDAGIHQRPRHQ